MLGLFPFIKWFRKIPSFLSTPSPIIQTSIKDKKYVKCHPAKYMKKKKSVWALGTFLGKAKGNTNSSSIVKPQTLSKVIGR